MDAELVMTHDVVSVGLDARVGDIAKLLLNRRISAVPVIDKDGAVVGMVSEGDLMRRPENETESQHSWWLSLFESPVDHAAEYLKTHGLTAEDIMTRDPLTVAPETPVYEIAETLERRRIKRVPVVRDGRLVGIVSRADLLRALAARKDGPPGVSWTSDKTIRKEILERLRNEHIISGDAINPVVFNGVVQLWGHVDSRQERDAVRVVAESINGVKSVENYIGILDGMARQLMWAE